MGVHKKSPLVGIGQFFTSLVALLAPALPGCSKPDPDLPNILIVSVDTLRADHLGAYGDTLVDTPSLDALADRSLVFENAYTSIPITTPSLTTLMTGRVPRNHGTLNNTYDLLDPDATLAEVLTERGYRSGAFLPSALADKAGFKRGFEVYDFPESFDVLREATDVVHRAATWMESVENADEGPWFCWVHVLEPHSPYSPPADLEAKYLPPGTNEVDPRLRKECIGFERLDYTESEVEILRALYRAEVEATDRALTPLIDWVERHVEGGARSAHGDILFAFTADHGELLYEHDQYVGHTAWLYEQMLRVPLMLRFTAGEYAGRRSPFPANLVDLFSTLSHRVGVAPGERDGVDLFANLDAVRRVMVHETFAPEGHYDQQAFRRDHLKYHRPIRGLPDTSERSREPRLFDTVEDVEELRDLASNRSQTVEELEAAFRKWAAAQRDPKALGEPVATPATLRFLEGIGYTQGTVREREDDEPVDGAGGSVRERASGGAASLEAAEDRESRDE